MVNSNPIPTLYPLPFYNRLKNEGDTQYSRIPRGKGFNIKRLVQNQAAWYVSANGYGKKSLILADWTAENWPNNKIKAIKEALNQLLDDGFSVFVWLDGQLIKLNRENLGIMDDRTFLSQIKPALDETIKNAAQLQQGLTADDTFILDDYWLKSLLEVKEPTHQLSLYEYAQTKHNRELILYSYRNKLLEEIIVDVFPSPIERLNELQKAFPNLPIKKQLKKISVILPISFLRVDKLQAKDCQTVEELTITFDIDTLHKLLPKIPNLRSLKTLNPGGDSGSWVTHYFPPLTHLEELIINHKIDPETLHAFLSSAPHLKRLTLSTLSNNDWPEQTIILEKLEELVFYGFNFYPQHVKLLSDIFLSAKNIKVIHFNTSSLHGKFLQEFQHLNLTSIEELYFSEAELLESLFDNEGQELHFSSLKKLKLLAGYIKKSPLLIAENLEVFECNVGDYKLTNTILHNSKKIKKLVLYETGGLTGTLQNFSATNLEELTLNGILLSDIDYILDQARKLRILVLNNVPNINLIKEHKVEDLEHLEIRQGAQFSNKIVWLGPIISSASRLKTIRLKNIDLSEPWHGTFALPNLESIDLQETSISSKNLQSLLTAAPNLKSLVIDDVDLLSPFDQSINLTSLEKFVFAGVGFISSENLNHILTHANQLKMLEIPVTKNLDTEKFNFPMLEELRLSTLRPDPKSLEEIIRKAPHSRKSHLKKLTLLANLGSFSTNLELRNLKRLRVSSCTFRPDSVDRLLSNATKLTDLNFDHCNFLGTFEPAENLNLSQLSRLTLQNCIISNDGLKQLLKSAPQLNFINLPKTRGFTIDAELKKLLSGKNVFPTISALQESKTQASPKSRLDLRDKVGPGAKSPKRYSHKLNVKSNLDQQSRYPKKTNSSKPVNVDANTGADLNPKKHHVKQIFYPVSGTDPSPLINYYRLEAYDTLNVNSKACDPEHAFQLLNQGDLNFDKTFIRLNPIQPANKLNEVARKLAKDNPTFRFLIGRLELTLTSNWQALPSTSPNEIMVHYHTVPAVKNIEFRYSKRDNLYYIRQTTPGEQTITLDFLIKEQRQQPEVSLPKDIEQLTADFTRIFGTKSLDLKGKRNPTGYDYLQSILDQKNGACRHRAVAFKALMQKKYPDKRVRIIYNECHAFVEIFHEERWVKRCLGGYRAQLIIAKNNPLMEKEKEKEVEAGSNKGKEKELIKAKGSNDIITSIQYDSPRVSPALMEYYTKGLQTWSNELQEVESVLHYCQLLVRPNEHKKRLVKLPNNQDLQALQLSLQGYCKSISRPCFYINSPDDLICSAHYLARQADNTSVLTKGPGGPLYDFLQANQDAANPPVLIINYDRFEADDIVRFNSLLDEVRLADGTFVPADALIIGLININKPDCYQGSDFYSRFDRKEPLPIASQKMQSHRREIVPLTVVSIGEQRPEKTAPIDLFFSPDWKTRLLGSWIIKGDQFIFKPGELSKALEKNLPIEIINGLWEDEEFQAFWEQAALSGYIEYEGVTIPWPGAYNCLYRSEGWDWDLLISQVQFDSMIQEEAFVLNPGLVDDFFNCYAIDNETQKLTTLPGHIEAFAGKTLVVTYSREIGEFEWARLLGACQEHKVYLQVHIQPGVELPKVFNSPLKPQPSPQVTPWDHQLNATTLIESTDIDTTLAQLTAKDNWITIDVSELNADDLLIHTHSEFVEETSRFIFKTKEQGFLKALHDKQNVILKGQFSPELADHLVPLLLNRQQSKEPEGQLVLLTANNPFSFLAANQHQVSANEKKEVLQASFPNANLELQNCDQSLTSLRAQLCYQARFPDEKLNNNTWEGFETLMHDPQIIGFDIPNSEALAKVFHQQRIAAVEKTLSNSPYVFLTGLTGVGKSTFVEKYFGTNSNDALYQGEGQMSAWAKDQTSKRKILFIDEANLSPKQWSELEGLFDSPPSLYLHGETYLLTDKHRIVFAGNPMSYGDERRLAPFFKRHGNAVVFEPLPCEVLYESVLKPILADLPLEEEALAVPMLDVYRFIVKSSQKGEILISPRELQMMAFLMVAALKNHQTETKEMAVATARYYAWQIGRNLVPETKTHEFDEHFYQANPHEKEDFPTQFGDFIITDSRKPLLNKLNDLLALREYRTRPDAKEEHLYGGLGGIIVEGSPGEGKSKLITQALRAQGYEEVHQGDNKIAAKPFYRIPVSMQTEDKKTLLTTAFHQGAVVIIDEINSSPMMERFLNDLLMGKTPDKKSPDKPGFLVIGTQNPVTMAGRRAPSPALARRLLTEVLPNYTEAELYAILIQKGLEASKANALVKAYLNNICKARNEGLNPMPTFRDLERLAEEEINNAKVDKPIPMIEDVAPINDRFLLLQEALLTQIDYYLKWQKNHDNHNRNHKPGLFTRNRHGKFGLLRAGALKEQLEEARDVIELRDKLIAHFEHDSRTHNHSLDSYLTDAIPDFGSDLGLQKKYDCTERKDRILLIDDILALKPPQATNRK